MRRLILGVAREALRESGARGLILVTPPSPEARVLGRWCREGGVPLDEPEPELVRSLAGPLEREAGSSEEGRGLLEARRAAARIRAGEGELIPVAAVNRTALLLSPAPPPEPFLPLGDMRASAVLELEGGCTLPPSFQELSGTPEALRAMEGFLEELRRSEEGATGDRGLAPELRSRVKMAVSAGGWWRRVPPLVPKLGPGSWGIDLDL